MSVLDLIQKAGAVRAVSGFAAEAVFGLAPGTPAPNRSARSRGIAKIRRDFTMPDGSPIDNRTADALYRRALRSAQRADREMDRQESYTSRGVEPPILRNRAGQERKAEYGIYVQVVSPRTGKEYRGQVVVKAPLGTSESVLADLARKTVIDRDVASMTLKGSRNYGVDPRSNWQVESSSIRWVNEL